MTSVHTIRYNNKWMYVSRLPTSTTVNSYLSRHTRSSETGLIDKRARSHHDALWRAWYNGLQTITIPAAFSTSALPNAAATSTSTSSPVPSSSASVEQQSTAAVVSSGQVMGDVVHHSQPPLDSPITDATSEDAAVAAAADESFDSLTLTLTMASAPRQEVSENQL